MGGRFDSDVIESEADELDGRVGGVEEVDGEGDEEKSGEGGEELADTAAFRRWWVVEGEDDDILGSGVGVRRERGVDYVVVP